IRPHERRRSGCACSAKALVSACCSPLVVGAWFRGWPRPFFLHAAELPSARGSASVEAGVENLGDLEQVFTRQPQHLSQIQSGGFPGVVGRRSLFSEQLIFPPVGLAFQAKKNINKSVTAEKNFPSGSLARTLSSRVLGSPQTPRTCRPHLSPPEA